jgi:transposase
MDTKLSAKYPEWATRHRTKGTELRLLKGKYYLYEYKTIYNPQKKKAKKITGKFLGRITEADGFITSDKLKIIRELERVQARESKTITSLALKVGGIREWGVSQYILSQFDCFLKSLEQYFKDDWQLIALLAYSRWLYQSPIKNMPFHIMQSWLYEQWKPGNVSERVISALLRRIGQRREQAVAYMRSFISEESYVLVDSTHILSKSSKIILAKKGYNSNMDFEPQISTMYLFSVASKMPVFYRINPGNIKEVKAFGLTLKESGVKDVILIGDKGFHSQGNVNLLNEERLPFILPLKRNHSLIDYSALEDGTIKTKKQYFEHQGRYIWYCVLEDNIIELDSKDSKEGKYKSHVMLCLFLDDALRNKEEKDYLTRMETNPDEYKWDGYLQKRPSFGTLAISSSLTKQTTPQQIYQAYKSRMAIEEMFDTLKNMLDTDSTYMQNEDALQGWMFINHIALQWYHQMYAHLKEKELLPRHSVKDMQLLLQEIRQVKIADQWHKAEITRKTEKLVAKIIKL